MWLYMICNHPFNIYSCLSATLCTSSLSKRAPRAEVPCMGNQPEKSWSRLKELRWLKTPGCWLGNHPASPEGFARLKTPGWEINARLSKRACRRKTDVLTRTSYTLLSGGL